MSTVQRNAIATPAEGLIVHDATEKELFIYKNGSWSKLATTTEVVVRVEQNNASQAIPDNSWTKINFNSKIFDSISGFNLTTDRFTPNKAGYYSVTGQILYEVSATNSPQIGIYKNGSYYCGNLDSGASDVHPSTESNCLIYLNGSTDYLEVYTWQGSGSALGTYSGTTYTNFEAFLISGGTGGGAGGNDNLGDHTATQNLTLGTNYLSGDGDSEGLRVDTSGNVGVGTTSPQTKLDVHGTVRVNDNGVQFYRSSSPVDDRMWLITHAGGDNLNFAPRKDDGASDGSYPLILERTGNVLMNAGNVGIGTTSPTQKLEVNGTVKATAFDLPIQYVSNTGPASAANMSATATCPANYKVIGGGCQVNISWSARILNSFPSGGGTSWNCDGTHDYSPSTYTITAHAICMRYQ